MFGTDARKEKIVVVAAVLVEHLDLGESVQQHADQLLLQNRRQKKSLQDGSLAVGSSGDVR